MEYIKLIDIYVINFKGLFFSLENIKLLVLFYIVRKSAWVLITNSNTAVSTQKQLG